MDEPHLGAANPYKMAATADGKHLVVLIEGTHEFLVIEREALHERLELAAKGESHSPAVKKPSDVPMDLAFLSGIRERYRLPGLRPYGIALRENRLWISLHFSDTIVSLALAQPQNQQKLVLNEEVKLTTAQQGEQLFHDATFCFQQWQSCATCHPSDARVDALNWDLLNDGIGNPKQTKSMLLSHATPPVMVSGVRGDATVAVRAGIRHIFFRQPDEDLAAPMDVYLSELTPVPSPELVNGELSEAAERGKKIFSDAGCAFCHSGEHYTNLKSYDVGTGGIRGGEEPLDTPTLVEVWRTAPYLKDGRAATIEEVLTKYNKEDKHGKTSGLSKEQVSDLATYVRSL
jgi:cytochrome c peroxidase